MSTLSLRLPQSIHQNAKLYAQREGISVNQLAATALAEKLAALATEDYIAQRGQRASAEKYAAALDLVQRHRMTKGFETARMYTGIAPQLPLKRLYGVTSFELG